MADAVPDHAAALEAVGARLIDILPEIKKSYYHPDLHGSFSLKSVLPALLPGEGYSGLDIADGIKALVAYTKLLDGEIPTGQQAAVRTDLLAYCGYDTEALVKIYRKLSGDT